MRTLTLSTIVAACILGLSACATPYQTPYQEMEFGIFEGVGVDQVTGNEFVIHAQVNRYTDPSVAGQYALRKAAEVTIANGDDLFLADSMGGWDKDCGPITNPLCDGVRDPIFLPTLNVWGMLFMVQTLKGPKPADAPPNLYDAREVLRYLVPPPAKDD